jgi:hypothetical protein
VLRVPEREQLKRLFVPALFIALAILVTLGYGSGVQLNDGQADLHIDPLRFLGTLLHAWNPALYLGAHTGFWYPYETPYAWFYGVAQIFHIPQDVAQRFAVFLVYTGCLASMYYCLRWVAPWISEAARVAGSVAFLFNMYVALNSQAQIIWLLVYATLPAMVGITARALRGELSVWTGAMWMTVMVLVGGGINPPLVAINVLLIVLYAIVAVALSGARRATVKRAIPFAVATGTACLLVNLYWMVPFVDYFRHVWLSGVLSEAPSLHNAATSFDNVLRGLGHWATFVSFGDHAYFPWAHTYESGFFGAMLWFVPIVALGGIAFQRNQRAATLYFLASVIVSVPIVVGYYHDAVGDAVTMPVYDMFYRYLPGFQMFRFSYKWIAGVEFGMSALYGLSAFALTSWLRDRYARLEWVPNAAAMALIAVPVFVFIPVIVHKMNYPGTQLPAWEYRENALVGGDQTHRVALFPTQFLEQFDWGNPEFYIENSLVGRPMIYGLLGSEPSQGTDVWVRRAYRAAREGMPFAADMFRVLGVDTFLQRDDFIPVIDFSSMDSGHYNSTTLTHDILHRVLGATPVRADGPLRVYHLTGALPLIYGVVHPVIATDPTFTTGYLGDVKAMAEGKARFDPQLRSAEEFSSVMRELSPILPQTHAAVRDLAVDEALNNGGVRIHQSSAEPSVSIPFEVKDAARYVVFARDESLLYGIAPPETLSIDQTNFTPESIGTWSSYGEITLNGGKHLVSDGYADPNLSVAVVRADDLNAWLARIGQLTTELPNNLAISRPVQWYSTTFNVPKPGWYRVTADAIGNLGPDGQSKARPRKLQAGGGFPANLGATLPYVLDAGVTGTAPLMMPPEWYVSDPAAYSWQRGDSESWFLFARHAHARVFNPGGGALVRVAMRASRLEIGNVLDVSVNGLGVQRLAFAGPKDAWRFADTTSQLQGPQPVLLTFTLRLPHGWSDVAFTFASALGQYGDLRSQVAAAAVAPDLSFTRVGSATAPSAPVSDGAFFARAINVPPGRFTGDPDISGATSSTGLGVSVTWLAVAYGGRNGVQYRLTPLPQNGFFDVNFMHAFPNDWYDSSRRVEGVWVIGRGARVHLSNVYYGLHAMPAREMRNSASNKLVNLPLRLDGKIIAKQPVFLRTGWHSVASAAWWIKMNLLEVDATSLPVTSDLTLQWRRLSETGINVTAPPNRNAFLLVFGSAFHPEWQAEVNGHPLDHVIVNGVSNGWLVPDLPAGGTIALRFTAQRSYELSAIVSLLSFIVLILLATRPDLVRRVPGYVRRVPVLLRGGLLKRWP